MWLTDQFLVPHWTTNSNFEILINPYSWHDQDNPTPECDTGYSEITNGQVEVRIDYEVAYMDGERSPMAFWGYKGGGHAFVQSEWFVLLQTYTVTWLDPNHTGESLTNLEFYQMLHGHPANEFGPAVSTVYDTIDWPDPLADYIPFNPIHQVGNFRYDITQWNDPDLHDPAYGPGGDHQDWIGFSTTDAPDVIENGIYPQGPGKPAEGTHVNIENRDLNGLIGWFEDDAAGAFGWHLGSLDPNESASITVAVMFGTGPIMTYVEILGPPLALEKTDNIETCVAPRGGQITYTISYDYLWNDPLDSFDPNSPVDPNGLIITDLLPSEVDFVSASQGGIYDSNTHTVTWQIGNLEGGAGGELQLEVIVNGQVMPGGTIENTAIASFTVSGYEYSQSATIYTDVCGCAQGDIIYVDKNATGENDGTSWENAYLDLHDALDRAQVCDQIWVAEGVYKVTDDPNQPYATFELVNGVSLFGGFAPGQSVDQGHERNWLKYETILCGDAQGDDDPNVGFDYTERHMSDNVNYVLTAGPNVKLSRLDGFTVRRGYYGGVNIDGGGVIIEHNRITENGNGILGRGAAVSTVKNNWIYRNDLGLYLDEPNLTVAVNNTVVNNESGGLYLFAGFEPILSNSIFWGHPEPNDIIGCHAVYSCVQHENLSDPNLIYRHNINVAPQFVDPDHDDYHLSENSPCIDAGDPNSINDGAGDIDGDCRIMDGDDDSYEIIDMGADEKRCGDTPNAADFNEDGIVNLYDYVGLSRQWLYEPPELEEKYDLNDDEIVSLIDLAEFCDQWLWRACWYNYNQMIALDGGAGRSMAMGLGMGGTESSSLSTAAETTTQDVSTDDQSKTKDEIIKMMIQWLIEHQPPGWQEFIKQIIGG